MDDVVSSFDTYQPLRGKRILLCVTGSIAAYKSVVLLRFLQKHGADVQVIMTKGAERFVTSLTFSTLSQKPVFLDLWEEPTGSRDWSKHVQMAMAADLILVAPATMNTLAKLANGICDDAVTATVFSSACPILIAPAMDHQMYLSPQNQNNLHRLRSFGYQVLEVEKGYLASGIEGEGRMMEPELIVEQVLKFLTPKLFSAEKHKLLINMGPTQEALDPVRYITNHSTGKMGIAIAKWAYLAGAQVTCVAGPLSASVPNFLKPIFVRSADEMLQQMQLHFSTHNMIIATAAVADFKPLQVENKKIKKDPSQPLFTLHLTPNPDILATLAEQKNAKQYLVGFALETHDEIENAQKKLLKKKADLIILNSTNSPNATFGFDTNTITFVEQNQISEPFSGTKEQLAWKILLHIAKQERLV